MANEKERRFTMPPPTTPPDKDGWIKATLVEAKQRKIANKVIDDYLKRFREKSLIQVLPVIARRCGDKRVIAMAIDRINRRPPEIGSDDWVFFEEFKIEARKKFGEKTEESSVQ